MHNLGAQHGNVTHNRCYSSHPNPSFIPAPTKNHCGWGVQSRRSGPYSNEHCVSPPVLLLRSVLWSPPIVTSTKTFKIKIKSALTTRAFEFNRCSGGSCYRIRDYVLRYTHTHTFSQTHNYEDRRTHTYAQPVSEIREWEIENPPDWALYLGIPDLFTLMSAGKKVKKNKSARQQLHVFGKQKLSFILSFGYIWFFSNYVPALRIVWADFSLWETRKHMHTYISKSH